MKHNSYIGLHVKWQISQIVVILLHVLFSIIPCHFEYGQSLLTLWIFPCRLVYHYTLVLWINESFKFTSHLFYQAKEGHSQISLILDIAYPSILINVINVNIYVYPYNYVDGNVPYARLLVIWLNFYTSYFDMNFNGTSNLRLALTQVFT